MKLSEHIAKRIREFLPEQGRSDSVFDDQLADIVETASDEWQSTTQAVYTRASVQVWSGYAGTDSLGI